MARLVINPSVDTVGECTSSGAVYFLCGLPSATVRPLIRLDRFSDTRDRGRKAFFLSSWSYSLMIASMARSPNSAIPFFAVIWAISICVI
eukprot:scaffold6298_cov113-Cylindrotheca_fusiformis.AAC.3